MSKSAIAGIKLMLSTGEYADVHFLVGDGDGKEILTARKLILMHASDVFKAMFRFDDKKKQAENSSANCPIVEIPDVEAAAFKVMLSFIYTDELSALNGDNAMAVLYAATKYNIPELVAASLQNLSPNCAMFSWLMPRPAFSTWRTMPTIVWLTLTKMLTFCSNLMLFWKLIKNCFPSGILTADEVAGVEQYHTNHDFCGISDRLLYPLQFPCNRRIWIFGTLLMDIEKVSEFVEQMAGANRHSETLYINGLPWRICANTKTKTGSTDNDKCLGIYLLFDAPEEDSHWHTAAFIRQHLELFHRKM
ncbi:hypothetical protein niasHT_017220 [Heterodera trifolii]|uniref:BTB domain-containing protein n=1 Tax=Heterodera trifolii TaxID=157864 RepID=A0ABD2L3K5_9BILA